MRFSAAAGSPACSAAVVAAGQLLSGCWLMTACWPAADDRLLLVACWPAAIRGTPWSRALLLAGCWAGCWPRILSTRSDKGNSFVPGPTINLTGWAESKESNDSMTPMTARTAWDSIDIHWSPQPGGTEGAGGLHLLWPI